MFCSHCGASMPANSRYCPACGTPVQAIDARPVAPYAAAIWNPVATANWSILFSPVFGAYLQMLNWQALGQPEKAAASRTWFYLSVGMIFLYVFMGIAFMDSKVAQGSSQTAGLGFLILWYFREGKTQVDYVREKFGKNYPRRPWSATLWRAFGILLAVVAATFALCFVLVLTGIVKAPV